MASDWCASMSWDAGRKRDFAGFTYVPPSTPLAQQTDITGQLPNQQGLQDDGLHWHFGFPTALLTAPLRHYQWGRYQVHPWFGKVDGAVVGYRGYMARPSTEEFYRGSQTRNPLPFTTLSAAQANNSSNSDCLFCGITEDGALWAWGVSRLTFTNPIGVGSQEDLPAEITHSGSGSASNKNIAYQPQPLYGKDDELVGVKFVKASASGQILETGLEAVNWTLVALTDDGKMYCCGNGGLVFGDGDYYTNPRATQGQNQFSYPTLVKGWSLTFGFVNGVFSGTVVERPARIWVDFAHRSNAGMRAIDSNGGIYARTDTDTQLSRTRPGGTYRFRVTENGRAYTAAPTVTATASPTGDTMTLTAAVSTSTPSGSGVVFTVTNWGSGYDTPPTITVSAPTGAGTKVTATAVVDQVIPINNKWKKIFTGGYGYFAINDLEELFWVELGTGFQIANQFDRLHDTVKFVKCAVGDAFLVALDKDGGVWTMGTANNGTASSRSTLQLLDAGPWVDIAAGAGHGVMLKANGEAWTWGQNAWGQLGIGSVTNSTTPVKVAGNAKWKRIFSGRFCTLATRDEELDALGNKLNPLTYAG